MKGTKNQEQLLVSFETKNKMFVNPIKGGLWLVIQADHRILIRGRLKFDFDASEIIENYSSGLPDKFFLSMKFLAATLALGNAIYPSHKKRRGGRQEYPK